MIFGIKRIYNFDPYNVLLAIATNIHVLHMTGFVVQGHTCYATIYLDLDNNNVLATISNTKTKTK